MEILERYESPWLKYELFSLRVSHIFPRSPLHNIQVIIRFELFVDVNSYYFKCISSKKHLRTRRALMRAHGRQYMVESE